MRYFTFLLVLFLFSTSAVAQSNKEIAEQKCREAIKLMDGGKVDESIELLEEVIKLDPDEFIYPYEMAYAHYLKKDYDEVIDILTELKSHKGVRSLLYQLLGNAYDMDGDPERAIATYDEGLKLFPNAGEIYLEKGTIYFMKEDYDNAIECYENGIRVQPTFPSNYFRAAQLFCNSSERIWGVIYGEIFMNLERNTPRTEAMSKMLYDTYKDAITFESDTSTKVSFTKMTSMDAEDLLSDPANFVLPYNMTYEMTMATSIINEKKIDAASLHRIRNRFLAKYFDEGWNKKYKNPLFDFQQQVADKGHFEAYNQWLFMMGDEQAFVEWVKPNETKFDSFATWFNENGIDIDNEKMFHRTMLKTQSK